MFVIQMSDSTVEALTRYQLACDAALSATVNYVDVRAAT
jgi:hypothetical protein